MVGDGVKLQGVHDENDMVHDSPRISPAPSSLPLSANCSVAERAAAIASSDTPLQQKQNMKHSQPDISQQAVPSAPADSDNCFQSLILESDQQVCLQTHQGKRYTSTWWYARLAVLGVGLGGGIYCSNICL